MRVAIDRGPLESGHKVRGIGAYTAELVKAIEKLDDAEVDLDVVDFTKTNLTKYDLIHYPHFHPFFRTLPPTRMKKIVVTVHDLIQLIYPKYYAPGTRGKIRFFYQKRALRSVDGIIAVSQTTKKDVMRFINPSEKKIKVIYEAPKDMYGEVSKHSNKIRQTAKKYGLPSRFVLYVGDVNYNKNVPTLISACDKAKLPLVICGKQALDIETRGVDIQSLRGPRDWLRFMFDKPHPELAHFNELLTQFKKNKNIYRLGFVPDDDLVYIYNLATVYVQPSFYEGFGLPVLEAMKSGTPVIVSKNNALVEVAGGAAHIADPKDEKDMADRITDVFSNSSLQVKLTRSGLKRAKEFSWKKTATETVDFYKEILKK